MTFETDFTELLLIVASLAIVFGLSRYVLHFTNHRKGLAKPNYSRLKFSGLVLAIGFSLYLALNWWSAQSFPNSGHRDAITNMSAFAGFLAVLFGVNAQKFVEKPVLLFRWVFGLILSLGLIWFLINFLVYLSYR